MKNAIDRNRLRLRQWLPWLDGSETLEQIRTFLADRIVENDNRTALTLGIWVRDEFAGAIGLHKIDTRDRATSIGYWIDEAHSGKGLMTNACRLVVSMGFQHYGLHRIEIRCATGNLKSAAVPLRLGFREEGLLREAEWLYDHWVDLRVFGMLQQDWQD